MRNVLFDYVLNYRYRVMKMNTLNVECSLKHFRIVRRRLRL